MGDRSKTQQGGGQELCREVMNEMVQSNRDDNMTQYFRIQIYTKLTIKQEKKTSMRSGTEANQKAKTCIWKLQQPCFIPEMTTRVVQTNFL